MPIFCDLIFKGTLGSWPSYIAAILNVEKKAHLAGRVDFIYESLSYMKKKDETTSCLFKPRLCVLLWQWCLRVCW